jgi:hypothetical protein
MVNEIDTPSIDQRIAQLEADIEQIHVTLRTLVDISKRQQQTLEALAPHTGQRNCRHCGRKIDTRSGKCPMGCKTRMGG